MNEKIWMHGTPIYFDKFRLPLEKQPHKGGLESHSAIFFTTHKDLALGAAEGTGGICTANLKGEAKVLNMNSCTDMQSEQYRAQCLKQRLGANNPQINYPDYWSAGWKSGQIMKYCPSSEQENIILQEKAILARDKRHTSEGSAAFNELQHLTRGVIEELVVSARALGYDAVVGNEIDTVHSPVPRTFETMFVINHEMLSEPSWLSKPNRA